MSVTVNNLVLGPAILYQGLVGAVEPTDAAVNTTPAASAWTDVGGTLKGLTLTVKQTYQELMVDQLVDAVGRRLTKREIELKTSLAEVTLANLQLALNGGTTATSAGYKTYDPSAGNSATIPTYAAVMMDGQAPLKAAGTVAKRRVIMRKVLSTASPTLEADKTNQSALEVAFQAHWVSSVVLPMHIVDEAD